jgi:hypothetical protein
MIVIIVGRNRRPFMTKKKRTMRKMRNRMLMKMTRQKMRKKKSKKIAKLVRRQMKTRNTCPLILMTLMKKVMQVCKPMFIQGPSNRAVTTLKNMPRRVHIMRAMWRMLCSRIYLVVI